MGQSGDTAPIADLLDERRHLLNVAYWMLGTCLAAEDAVAEAYRRWYALTDVQRTRVTEPRSWLTRTTGIICLTRLPLPEHRAANAEAKGNATGITHDRALTEEINNVLFETLGTLSPAEQAAFILDDGCALPRQTVADVTGTTPAVPEELTDSARRAVHTYRTYRARPDAPQQHDKVVRGVRQACATHDVEHLASLLAPEVTAFFDGGGKVRALTRPVHGNQRVVRALLTLLAPRPHTTLHLCSANGRTAIVVRYGDQVAAVISFDVAGHHATHIWAVLNPDKLRAWNRSRHPVGEHDAPGG
ncbi:sigma factor [Streptomyces sp. TLI_185]|uniref:sigma factor n=1 Tax=Streptomyces sp. TLI_185 TaxID=2485151 RepID=UPI000F4DFF18|nr:sigma factor [Streptomyces sp. TLI_185]RPF30477.1 RNA polymerase sigma-70 factor (ECF subfamily) [Streptomyces sp. TLI_185]